MRHLSRRLIGRTLALSLLLLLPAVAWAREAVVTTRDGRQFTGEVVADNEHGVVLLIAGIRTPVKREDVQSVEYKKTIDEQYQERKAAVAADNVDERYNLARWLFEERAYRLALTELDEMAEQFPDDSRVRHLRPLVEARLKLAAEAAASAQQPSAPQTPAAETPTTAGTTRTGTTSARTTSGSADALPDNRLDDDQINMIKVYEVRIEDRPAVIVSNDVVNELMEKYAADPLVPKGRDAQNAVRRAQGWQQLDLMFRLRAREFYPLVDVRSDPESVRLFRTGVHRRYVLPYCGSTDCHGGERAGDFFLFQLRPNDEDTVYSNFYILSQYRNAAGMMIDRENPERSLLLQYGLPRTDAATPHPQVPGWAAYYRSRSDPRIEPILDWLRVMPPPGPSYPINYTPPTMKRSDDAGSVPAPIPDSTPSPGPVVP